MKRKWFSKEEKMQKQLLEHLTRRQFMTYGIQSGATLAIPGLLSSLLRETTAYAAFQDRGQAKMPVVQIHTPGGPLEYIYPRLGNGEPLPQDKVGAYGILPDVISTNGVFNSQFAINKMGVTWFNRSRTDTINATTVNTVDFIIGLLQQAGVQFTDAVRGIEAATQPATAVDFSRVHAYNIASDSDDDDATGEHSCNNVLSAGGFKGKLTDAIDISGGLRATQALKFAFNPFNAPTTAQIRALLAYTPAFSGKSNAVLDQFTTSLKDLGDLQSSKLFKTLTTEEQTQLRERLGASLQDNKAAIDPNRFGTNLDISADQDYIDSFNNVAPGKSLASADILTYATGLESLIRGVANFMGFTYRNGMDYHQNAVVTNNGNGTLEKDGDVGRLIGATINVAMRKKKDLMIVITKDGACRGTSNHLSTDPNVAVATSDNGERASQIVIVVNGSDTPLGLTRVKQQLGARRADNGQVDNSILISRSDINCSSAIGAAILYFNGVPISEIRQIYPLFASDADVLNALALKV